jgi:hypothetical protein
MYGDGPLYVWVKIDFIISSGFGVTIRVDWVGLDSEHVSNFCGHGVRSLCVLQALLLLWGEKLIALFYVCAL